MNLKNIKDSKGGIDPRSGKKLSKKSLLEYDGPIYKFSSTEAYLKENPVYGEDYIWIHQDGTPLDEQEVKQLKFK